MPSNSDQLLLHNKPGKFLDHDPFDKAAYLLFSGITIIFLLTFRDYGYSWDEVTQNRWYGQAVLRFIQSLGEEQGALHTNNFYLYGGLFDAIAELIPHITPLDGFESRRFANASIGMLALVGAWKTARYLSGPEAGFWALLFLVTTPVWYGHTFINAKDIPFAAGYIWSLYFTLRSVEKFPDVPWGTAVGLGAAWGLSIGIRVGGVLVILYFFMMVCLYVSGLLLKSKSSIDLKSIRKGIFHKAALSLSIAWVMMATFWPTVFLYPAAGLIDAFQAASHFRWGGDILYNGVMVNASEIPWHYLPVYFGVKLPTPILLIFVFGILWALVNLSRYVRQLNWPAVAGPGLLIFAIIFPPVYAVSSGAIIYDGVRHFLFIIPPTACLAGIAMADLITTFKKSFKLVPKFIFGAVGIYMVFHIWTMMLLHPYQYAYLNRLGGGIPGAAENYETDYWITSYREATFAMLDYAKDHARFLGIPFEQLQFEVAIFGDVNIVRELVPENFVVIDMNLSENSDFYIASTRMGFDKKFPTWRVVGEIERMGMTFAVLKTSLPSMSKTAE